VIENASDIRPAMVANIRCGSNENCKIRVYVYYSSNLSNGKEILLAGASFELRDLVNSRGIFSPKGTMFSEHCDEARATLFTLGVLPGVLTSEGFSTIASPNAFNPMSQQYVFYSWDSLYKVHCEELSFEPRLATKVRI
jgi:hypothetical protein